MTHHHSGGSGGGGTGPHSTYHEKKHKKEKKKPERNKIEIAGPIKKLFARATGISNSSDNLDVRSSVTSVCETIDSREQKSWGRPLSKSPKASAVTNRIESNEETRKRTDKEIDHHVGRKSRDPEFRRKWRAMKDDPKSSSSSSSSRKSDNKEKKELILRARQKERAKSSAPNAPNSPQRSEEPCGRIPTVTESNSIVDIHTAGKSAEDSGRDGGSQTLLTSGQAILLRQLAAQCQAFTLEKLWEDFRSLPMPTPNECQGFRLEANQYKNRYNDIMCLDATRVIVRFAATHDFNSTYIHANRVDYVSLAAPFIITQGPVPRTVTDFWRMIWQEKTSMIIMLCKTVENGKHKCAAYYPIKVNSSSVVGPFTLTAQNQHIDNGVICTNLTLEYSKTTRDICHYQVVDWPDCRAPSSNSKQLFTVLKNCRSSRAPVVVHCSAGIGRSGTLVALEMLLMDLNRGVPLDVMSVVRTLRYSRCRAVQSIDQLLAIYQLLLKYGQMTNVLSEADCRTFTEMYDSFRSKSYDH